MDVIGSAPNSVSWTITIPAQSCQICVHARPDGGVKPGAAVLGAEDGVENNLAKGLRHKECWFDLSRSNRAGN
jgi:hypothetical protein